VEGLRKKGLSQRRKRVLQGRGKKKGSGKEVRDLYLLKRGRRRGGTGETERKKWWGEKEKKKRKGPPNHRGKNRLSKGKETKGIGRKENSGGGKEKKKAPLEISGENLTFLGHKKEGTQRKKKRKKRTMLYRRKDFFYSTLEREKKVPGIRK